LPISDTALAYPAEVTEPLLAAPCATTSAPLHSTPLKRVAFRIAFLYLAPQNPRSTPATNGKRPLLEWSSYF